jgi:hypothetical protein
VKRHQFSISNSISARMNLDMNESNPDVVLVTKISVGAIVPAMEALGSIVFWIKNPIVHSKYFCLLLYTFINHLVFVHLTHLYWNTNIPVQIIFRNIFDVK